MSKTKYLSAVALMAVSAAVVASPLEVSLIDRNTGERMQTWRHEGRLYVAGRPGDRYAVELRNRSGGRVLAVLSVDGVNAITGETAAASQPGYVLDAGQQARVAGWRKSLDEVAAFYFTRLPDSYGARTGRPENVGVIGVAVYREYEEPRAAYEAPAIAKSEAAGAAGRLAAAPAADEARDAVRSRQPAEERLGTGHGERIASATRTTEFRRASPSPAAVVTIYYDSRANLVARGVIPAPRDPDPRPFPGGFVPDPGC